MMMRIAACGVGALTVSRAMWRERARKAERAAAVAKAKGTAGRAACAPQKQNAQCLGEPEIIGVGGEAPRCHHYGANLIHCVVTMMQESISARGAAKAVAIADACLLGGDASTANHLPGYSSARLWLLRVGYHKLMRPKTTASDWIWIVDHTIQTGAAKCLVILGVRLSEIGADFTLSHHDMEPILIAPMATSTATVVMQKLTEAAMYTGVPRAIVSDGGSDLRAGIRAYTAANPSTVMIYDVHHKTVIELKRVLGQDDAWRKFTDEANHFKRLVQQTPLASLAPPSQRGKARFMNINILVHWLRTVLLPAYRSPGDCAKKLGVAPTMVMEKLAWVSAYEAHIPRWDEISFTAEQCTAFIRREGYHADAADTLAKLLPSAHDVSVAALQQRLFSFIREESSQAKPGEQFKRFAGETARSGFTASVLAIAAMVSHTTRDVIVCALESHGVKCISEWATKHIGKTVQAQRRMLTLVDPEAV